MYETFSLDPAQLFVYPRNTMPWECLVLKQGEKSFTLRGEGLLYHGQVWQGRMGQDVYWGLKALQTPQAAQRVLRPHRLYVPREHLNRPNTGKDRRVVHLLAEGLAPVVLKFQETIEPELVRALRGAFSKGERHAEVDPGTEHGTADPARAGGQGGGHHHDRQPAQGRRRARVRPGQEVARPKRNLKRKARKSR